jgi:dynamin 1-like protein
MISLTMFLQPPAVLRSTDAQTEQETLEIAVTRLLLKSYYDIVRKNIQDAVPKAIMHFLVNHVKRELHSVFIRKLYRESLFEEMMQEKEDVAVNRKHCKEILQVLQQAAWVWRTLLEPTSVIIFIMFDFSRSSIDNWPTWLCNL